MRNKKIKNFKIASVFIGNYLDESILKERNLPAPNPAGSNRMLRLSKAIESKKIFPYIISQASSARIGFNSKIVHPIKVRRKDGVVIIYASALAIPYLSVFYEVFSMLYIFLRLLSRRNLKLVFLYCYYPSTILVGLVAKVRGLQIVEDLEDIVTPKWNDIWKSSFLVFVQQSLGFMLMKVAISMADLIIIPTGRFTDDNLAKRNTIVIDGCVDVVEEKVQTPLPEKITVLLAGLLDDEQGLQLFLGLLELLQNNPSKGNEFNFKVCGVSSNQLELESRLRGFAKLDVKYYGFVSSDEFSDILLQSQVCLVLQDPNGRNSMQKTPSKGYEYMAAGKTIIVTRIGDYVNIPNDNLLFLSKYTSEDLYSLLINLNPQIVNRIGISASKFASLNWSFLTVGEKLINSLKK